MKPVGRGTCFAVVGIVVELPFLTRPLCLPVTARLRRPKTGPTKAERGAVMVKLLVAYLDRPLPMVAETITLTTRLPASAVLFNPASPLAGKRGRPRLKGAWLSKPAELAQTAPIPPGTAAAPTSFTSPTSTVLGTAPSNPRPPV